MTKSTSLAWRKFGERYVFDAEECVKCGRTVFPKRMVCPHCGGTDFNRKMLSGAGKIISFTNVTNPPSGERPYHLVLVEFEEGEGVRVFGQSEADGEEPEEGMDVTPIFRILRKEADGGIIHYSYKFAKAEKTEAEKKEGGLK